MGKLRRNSFTLNHKQEPVEFRRLSLRSSTPVRIGDIQFRTKESNDDFIFSTPFGDASQQFSANHKQKTSSKKSIQPENEDVVKQHKISRQNKNLFQNFNGFKSEDSDKVDIWDDSKFIEKKNYAKKRISQHIQKDMLHNKQVIQTENIVERKFKQVS